MAGVFLASRSRQKLRSCSPKRLRRCAKEKPVGVVSVGTPVGFAEFPMGPGNGESGQIHDPRTGGESCGNQGAVQCCSIAPIHSGHFPHEKKLEYAGTRQKDGVLLLLVE